MPHTLNWMPLRGEEVRHRESIDFSLLVSGFRSRERLEFFAGFEADSFSGRDAHLLARPRVAPNAGLARLDVEDAEAAQLDALAFAEGVLHGLEDGLDGLLGFVSGDVRFLNHRVHDVQFDHNGLPAAAKSMLDRGLRVVKRSAAG
jgi:hypothetical protein